MMRRRSDCSNMRSNMGSRPRTDVPKLPILIGNGPLGYAIVPSLPLKMAGITIVQKRILVVQLNDIRYVLIRGSA